MAKQKNMLRQFKFVTLILIAIIWFIIILPYFLIQTELGAKYTSQFISKYTDNYHISIDRISHSFAKPYELTLENLIITNKQQTATYLSTNKLVIGLKKTNPLQTQSFDYLIIENGQLELMSTSLAIECDFLQLKNTTLHYSNPENEIAITLNHVYGGIKPWSSKFITERQDGQFNFTVGNAKINRFNIKSILMRGIQKDKTLRLTDFGGNINQGFFTVKSSVLPNNDIEVNQLNIQNINFQSSINLTHFNEIFDVLPKITIHLLSITNSSINIPPLMVEKANIEAKNIVFADKLQLQHSDLLFNAQSIIWHDELIESPLIQWHNEDNKIEIEHAMALWNKGNFRLNGNWDDHVLTIDNAIVNGLRYQLPTNWYQSLYFYSLPDFFPANIEIKNFILMPSLIIDTTPSFPFQFSEFEAFGKNIKIEATDHEISIGGSISMKADNSTINTIELKHPALNIELESKKYLLNFSTLIDDGIVEGQANLSTMQQLPSFALHAHSVNSQILSRWYLMSNPIQTNNFNLKLHGELIPLSLEGQLQTNKGNYLIKNNQIISGE